MKRVDGWIVLADISGYTAFLTQTALDHAQAILEELLRGLHKSLSVPLRVIKLEGDAVLACAPSDVLSGDDLVERLLDVYRSFRLHVLSIERCTTCRCVKKSWRLVLDGLLCIDDMPRMPPQTRERAFLPPSRVRSTETSSTQLSLCTDRKTRLRHAPLRRQDRCAILAMNCLEYYEAYAAAEYGATILVPVNYRLAPAEIVHITLRSST